MDNRARGNGLEMAAQSRMMRVTLTGRSLGLINTS